MPVEYKTFAYKKLSESQNILLDVYFPDLPSTNDGEVIPLPVVVFFHGGAFTIGNRQSWRPDWLIERCLALGYAFVSADYRLLVPATGHHIVEDLQDVFKYIASNEIKGDKYTLKLDGDRIAVAGGSAGGLCAYLASIHCSPKPKALVSIYGTGGSFLTRKRVAEKAEGTMFIGQPIPLFDKASFEGLTFPFSPDLPMVTDFPVDPKYFSMDPSIVIRENPRMVLHLFLFQQGKILDYYTGLHDPSISTTLRVIFDKENATPEDCKLVMPERERSLFPQFYVDKNWPPTLLLHGTADDLVLIDESLNMKRLCESIGAPVELIEVEGQPHGFDVLPNAEELHKAHFDATVAFIQKYL